MNSNRPLAILVQREKMLKKKIFRLKLLMTMILTVLLISLIIVWPNKAAKQSASQQEYRQMLMQWIPPLGLQIPNKVPNPQLKCKD